MTQRQTFLVENYFLVMGQRQELWANAYHKMSRFQVQLVHTDLPNAVENNLSTFESYMEKYASGIYFV